MKTLLRMVVLAVVAAAVIVLAVAYRKSRLADLWSGSEGPVRTSPSEDVVVVRTPGGTLEVSQLRATETLDEEITHTLLGIPVGKTVPRIRVPAVYRYHIELAPEWRLVRRQGTFELAVPQIAPTLPVAVDFKGMEKDVSGTWVLIPLTQTQDLELLERRISALLEAKARSAMYLSLQREAACRTVAEFAAKWVVGQTQYQRVRPEDMRVHFEGDAPGRHCEPNLRPRAGMMAPRAGRAQSRPWKPRDGGVSQSWHVVPSGLNGPSRPFRHDAGN